MRRNDLRALYTRNAAERSVPSKVVSIGLPQASRTEAYRSNLVRARRLRAGRAAALSRTSAGCAKTPGGWPGENGSQKSQKQMVAGRRPLTMGCAVWSLVESGAGTGEQFTLRYQKYCACSQISRLCYFFITLSR
jgi:hypothetical protein